MQPSWDLRRVVPDDRAAVLKATVEFATSKVGQALGPPAAQCINGCTISRDPLCGLRDSLQQGHLPP